MTNPEVDIQEIIARVREEKEAKEVAAIRAAVPAEADEITVMAEYALTAPVLVDTDGLYEYGAVVTRVRVERTTWTDPQTEPYVQVQGWARPATKTGNPGRKDPRWIYLSPRLAEHLTGGLAK